MCITVVIHFSLGSGGTGDLAEGLTHIRQGLCHRMRDVHHHAQPLPVSDDDEDGLHLFIYLVCVCVFVWKLVLSYRVDPGDQT